MTPINTTSIQTQCHSFHRLSKQHLISSLTLLLKSQIPGNPSLSRLRLAFTECYVCNAMCKHELCTCIENSTGKHDLICTCTSDYYRQNTKSNLFQNEMFYCYSYVIICVCTDNLYTYSPLNKLNYSNVIICLL